MQRVPVITPGFMSTFAACKHVNTSETLLLWATPQAINPLTSGTVARSASGYTATTNYGDPSIAAQLNADVEAAVASLFGANISLNAHFYAAAYHWTGDEATVQRSRIRNTTNLYVADAMAVVGPTSGWTSFNARVAGVAAAMRAVRADDEACVHLPRLYQDRGCCAAPDAYCAELEGNFADEGCCP